MLLRQTVLNTAQKDGQYSLGLVLSLGRTVYHVGPRATLTTEVQIYERAFEQHSFIITVPDTHPAVILQNIDRKQFSFQGMKKTFLNVYVNLTVLINV